MNNIIAFEGMPGAGKTTLINNIKENNLLNNCIVFPELKINGIQKDNLSGSKDYLDAEVNKLNIVNNLKKEYKNILLDRTFLATLSYCYARSKLNGNNKEYLELIQYFRYLDNKYHLLRPTHIFYLDVTIPISIRRRNAFSHITEFHNWFNPKFLKYFSEFYSQNMNKFNMPKCIFIDTTLLSKKDVAESFLSFLKK